MVLSLGLPKLSPKSNPTSRRSLLRTSSSHSTLTEALKTNPFNLGSTESLAPEEGGKDGVPELNQHLTTIAELFPDVQFEVIRELLQRFDGNSRLEICAEQLFKHKAEWVKGRYSVPPRELGERPPSGELFQKKSYRAAVRQNLCLEFSALSKSAIDGVLAETNYSYTQARPILLGLASKSWRAAFSNLFRKKKPPEKIPSCLLEPKRAESSKIVLRPTGSPNLDQELALLFLKQDPPRDSKAAEAIDLEYAQKLNYQEAENAEALFECQCCYNDVPFESISTCTSNMHVICVDCIRRTVQEALFGQGWAKSIDSRRGTLKCLAPLPDGDCDGYLPRSLVERSILIHPSGSETWSKYEERCTTESLNKSQLPVVNCPFCSYAEADQAYDAKTSRKLRWHFRKTNALASAFLLFIFLNFLPLILFVFMPLVLFTFRSLLDQFYTSLGHLALRRRPTRFRCQNPSCKRASCLKCHKAWHDPHTCHEPLLLSLRTTVEAARTAAVKRTCPRCGTSFVKSSGCNKLTCTCGYAMCYICRKNIGRSSNNDENGEGYMHFCEHFRPTPGRPCTECQKCDLYQSEDEDLVARRAGEEAERSWRIREGVVAVKGLEEAIRSAEPQPQGLMWLWERLCSGDWEWSSQTLVDWAVERVVVVEED